MKKLICVILLLSIAGSALAVDSNWNNNGGDRLWRNGANWSDGVPTTTGKAGIRASIDGPIIDASTTATADMVVVGDWGNTDSLDITGGSFTTNDWFILGFGGSDDGTFNVSGGTTSVGGVLTVGRMGVGHLNMISGTVTVDSTFGIATNGGSGDVQLDGGTISCDAFSMAAGATMSIANTGKLEVNGDATLTINGYRISGWLSSYGGSGTLSIDYNAATGKTTVTANNTPEKAANPTPGNGTINVGASTDLSWTPGMYATSHDVYFGTDLTPDASEFKGNQPGTTFDPGTLNMNTTYYWRIDEVDTGNPASPWTGIVWSFKTQTTSSSGKIVRPWRSTTAIVKAGETFEVWFDADSGQTVNSVVLQGPYNSVSCSESISTGSWEYDKFSHNTYDTKITVTVPANAPADRYDLLLNTSYGQAISVSAVKVIKEYKDSYYIMHMSDAHRAQGGYDETHTLRKVSEIVKIANIIDPEMLFETGDNQYSVRNHPEREVSYYHGLPAEGIIGMHDAFAATFMCAGNHDSPNNNYVSDTNVAETADFFNTYYGLHIYNFTYGNGRFTVHNDAWGGSMNTTGQGNDAAAWLNSVGRGNFILGAAHTMSGTFAPFNRVVNVDIAIVGHNHYLANDNPHLIDGDPINYVADSVRDLGNFEFNLFKVNNNTGAYVPVSGSDARCQVIQGDSQSLIADPGRWIPNLQISYSQSNDGASPVNTATIINNYDFSIESARVRFVMPLGMNYGVSQGTVTQQFEGDSVHVVDVAVDLTANSTTVIEIIQSVNIYGDINNDKIVNYQDLALFGLQWLDTGCGTCGGADYTGDGDVTIDDLLTVAQYWLADYTLIANWKLDETAGAIASDSSRNGYDGTLVNMDDSDWVEGNTDNALDFDGINDYVATGDVCTALAGANVTVSAWMKAPALNPATQFIIAINSSTGDNKLMFGTQASTATLSFADSEPLWRDTTATVIDNTWHHIAFVLNDSSNTVTVYVDGIEALSFTSTVSIAEGDILSLGQEYDAGLTTGDFYNGLLDDVKVYDYALSDTQVRHLYDPSGLLAHWNLDETTGAVAADDSANGYDGTLVNMDDSDWVPGIAGNGLEFDGVDDHVVVDGICAAMAGRDVTVSAWVKAPAVNPANQFIISINSSNGDDNKLLMGTQAGTATLSLGDTAWHDTTTTVIDNTWHHIAYVLEDSADTITVYVDGAEVLSYTSTVSIAADDILSFGQEYDAGLTPSDFYDGQIDEVRVYDRALSEGEIGLLAQ